MTKEEFLKDAEKAWNNYSEYGKPETYTIIFSGEYGCHYGTMDCEDILSWAMDHNITKRVKAVIKKQKNGLFKELEQEE